MRLNEKGQSDRVTQDPERKTKSVRPKTGEKKRGKPKNRKQHLLHRHQTLFSDPKREHIICLKDPFLLPIVGGHQRCPCMVSHLNMASSWDER